MYKNKSNNNNNNNFDKYLYPKYSYTQMRRWAGIFQKLRDPIVMTLLASREECHLDFSPKSCAHPTLSTIDPLEVNIISISLFSVNFDFSWSFTCHNVTSQRDTDLSYLTLAIFRHEILKSCYNYLTKFISPCIIYLMHFIVTNDFIRAKHW